MSPVGFARTGGVLASRRRASWPAPKNAVLDDFNRADAAPATGWTTPITVDEPNAFQTFSNQLTRQTGGSSGVYTASAYPPDQEAFFSLPAFGNSSVGPLLRVTGSTSTMAGYAVVARTTDLSAFKYATGTGGPGAGVSVQVGNTVTMTWGDGDRIWATITGSNPTVITAYRSPSGSSSWTQVGQFSDSSSPITASGKIGAIAYAFTTLIDDFGGGSVDFARDSFTDTTGTALASHTPEAGGTWTVHTSTGSGTGIITATGTLRSGVTSQAYVAYLTATSPASSQTVEWDHNAKTLLTSEASGPFLRLSTSALTGYQACYLQTSSLWVIRKVTAGSFATFASGGTAPTNGTVPHCKFSAIANGANVDLSLSVAGTVVASGTDSSSPITSPGQVGVRLFSAGTPSDTVGYHLDNLAAY